MAHVAGQSDTELVLAACAGGSGAFAQLFERWFDRAYDVARNIVRNDEIAAEVAQDTFLAAWQGLATLQNPDAFGGWVLRIARNRALNRLSREQRSRPMDSDVMSGVHDAGAPDPTGSSRLIETEAISEVRDRQELVWAAAAALGARDASVLDLHLRHGLGPAEIAEELGVTANNAHQLLFRLRNRLGGAISGYLLWRNGRPRCPELARMVDGSTFDPDTLKVIDRHVSQCEVCSDQRTRVVDPHRLFAATPLLVAPALLKAKAARALSQAGVPVGPGDAARPPGTDAGARAQHRPESAIAASSRRRRRMMAALAAAAVVIGAVVAWSTRSGDGGGDELVSATSPAPSVDVSTTRGATSTLAPTTSAPTSTTGSTSTSTTSTTVLTTTTLTTVPSTTVPSVVVPPSNTTTTTATVPTTTTTLPPAPVPVIVRFTSTAPAGVTLLCLEAGQVPRRFVWSTTDATNAVLTIGSTDTAVDPNGSRTSCAPSGSTVTLTVTGPGGTSAATTTVP